MSSYARGSLGWWIDDRRAELGITSQELSRRAGVSRETLYRVTGGRSRQPEASTMKAETRKGFERALQWQPGSIEAILDGGEPTVCESTQRPVNTSIEGYALRLYAIQHRDGRGALMDEFSYLAEDEGDDIARAALTRMADMMAEDAGAETG